MRHKQVIGVLGLLTDGRGKVLITLRNEPELPEVHHKWQIPGGGVEFGEEPLVALHREMKEELGVEIEIIALIPYVGSSVWNHPYGKEHAILFCYLCKAKKDQIIKLDSESSEARWVFPHEINTLSRLPLTDDFVLAARPLLHKAR